MAQGKEAGEASTPRRWTAKRKAAVVLEALKGKTTPAGAGVAAFPPGPACERQDRAWRRQFRSLEEARGHIGAWIVWCNSERLRQALGYMTPDECHAARRSEVSA